MSVYSTSPTDILGVYIVYVCIVIVLIENTCEMQFHTYSPRPKRRQVVVAHWFCAGGNSAQATPWLLVRTWNRAAGYEFLIPTSGRRLGITGGRFPTLAFQLGNRTRVEVSRSAPHLIHVHSLLLYLII